ncbi:MAG: zf-HC2 domain-containing protein [Anaerolineales bacterium]|jgi:anti-sigma factor (TIGR02949 family)
MVEHESCQELLQGLSAYIDNEASEKICREIERHLEECDNCRIMLDTMRKTISLYQAADGADQIPGDIEERLLNTLHIDDA